MARVWLSGQDSITDASTTVRGAETGGRTDAVALVGGGVLNQRGQELGPVWKDRIPGSEQVIPDGLTEELPGEDRAARQRARLGIECSRRLDQLVHLCRGSPSPYTSSR
jgi:hypothetical protein